MQIISCLLQIIILFTRTADNHTVYCKSIYCLLQIIVLFSASQYIVYRKSSYCLLQLILLFSASKYTVYCKSSYCLLVYCKSSYFLLQISILVYVDLQKPLRRDCNGLVIELSKGHYSEVMVHLYILQIIILFTANHHTGQLNLILQIKIIFTASRGTIYFKSSLEKV